VSAESAFEHFRNAASNFARAFGLVDMAAIISQWQYEPVYHPTLAARYSRSVYVWRLDGNEGTA
jgi:hypothetical protein